MKFLTIGQKLGREECPYMRRWVLNLGFCSFRIHHWYYGDDPRNFHDHPWWFFTYVIRGGYTDVTEEGREYLFAGNYAGRPSYHRHTVDVHPGGCWTFLFTGPVKRKWGFWVNGKFKRSNKYFLEHGHHPCNEN